MDQNINRREFIAVAAGPSAARTSSNGSIHPMPTNGAIPDQGTNAVVPRRAFGNTGVRVSKLALGGSSMGGAGCEALLDEALKHGVDLWETTLMEGGIKYGEYFKKNPGAREKVFLLAKTSSTNPAVMQEQLDKTLREIGTSAIDFFAIT